MWARRSGLTYPALPWVVILGVSMVYFASVAQTKNEQVPRRVVIVVVQYLVVAHADKIGSTDQAFENRPPSPKGARGPRLLAALPGELQA